MKQTGHVLTRLFLLDFPFTASFSHMIWSRVCKVAVKRKILFEGLSLMCSDTVPSTLAFYS